MSVGIALRAISGFVLYIWVEFCFHSDREPTGASKSTESGTLFTHLRTRGSATRDRLEEGSLLVSYTILLVYLPITQSGHQDSSFLSGSSVPME
jgi:hypothetical protein